VSDYSAVYDPDADVDRLLTDATGAAIARFVRPGDRILELGCATGRMTAALVASGARVVAADRAEAYLERLLTRGLDGVEVWHGDLDGALPAGTFEHVVAANVLHEVADPVGLLARAAGRLVDRGLVHVTLQNPDSLHRLVAREMGLLDDLAAVSERGARFGTRRLWSADALEALMGEAGLRTVHREGLVLKPLPNALLAGLPEEVLAGLAACGRYAGEHAAMTYLAAEAA
jgi:SAM-dependent methyltransferase